MKSSYLLRQRNVRATLGSRRVARGEKVADEEQEQEELNGGPHRVILVARAHVSQEDGRAGQFLEGRRDFVQEVQQQVLRFVEIHLCLQVRVTRSPIRDGSGSGFLRCRTWTCEAQ